MNKFRRVTNLIEKAGGSLSPIASGDRSAEISMPTTVPWDQRSLPCSRTETPDHTRYQEHAHPDISEMPNCFRSLRNHVPREIGFSRCRAASSVNRARSSLPQSPGCKHGIILFNPAWLKGSGRVPERGRWAGRQCPVWVINGHVRCKTPSALPPKTDIERPLIFACSNWRSASMAGRCGSRPVSMGTSSRAGCWRPSPLCSKAPFDPAQNYGIPPELSGVCQY